MRYRRLPFVGNRDIEYRGLVASAGVVSDERRDSRRAFSRSQRRPVEGMEASIDETWGLPKIMNQAGDSDDGCLFLSETRIFGEARCSSGDHSEVWQ